MVSEGKRVMVIFVRQEAGPLLENIKKLMKISCRKRERFINNIPVEIKHVRIKQNSKKMINGLSFLNFVIWCESF